MSSLSNNGSQDGPYGRNKDKNEKYKTQHLDPLGTITPLIRSCYSSAIGLYAHINIFDVPKCLDFCAVRTDVNHKQKKVKKLIFV